MRKQSSVLLLLLLLLCPFWDGSTMTIAASAKQPPPPPTQQEKRPPRVKKTPDDYRVVGLDQIEPAFSSFEGTMYAGLIPIGGGGSGGGDDLDDDATKDNDADHDRGELMFWLFEPARPVANDSLLVWFNGGPGCTSFQAGLFFETSPVTTPMTPAGYPGDPEDTPFQANPTAWTNATSIMYVEQPVGVGFSRGGTTPVNETDVASDFYHWIQSFYAVFAEQRAKRLYLVGESYAGYYVPSMAHYIYERNMEQQQQQQQQDPEKQGEDSHVVNLAGIALGNGWADAAVQSDVVIDYAYWHGMIDSVTRDALHAEWEHCKLRSGSEPEPFHPFTVPDECGIMPAILTAAGAGLMDWGAPNTYDVTTWDPYASISGDNNTIGRFFNNPAVQTALHVPLDDLDKPWMGCIPGAGRRRRRGRRGRRQLKEDEAGRNAKGVDNNSAADGKNEQQQHEPLPGEVFLKDDKPESMKPYITDLLDGAGIQVLIYNGDRDLSTCAQGSELMLDTMTNWTGHDDWLDPTKYSRALWMVNEAVAGYAKAIDKHQLLQFVIVLNSGHMVPHNVPIPALDLVTRLVQNRSFIDVPIPFLFEQQQIRHHPLAVVPDSTTTTTTISAGHGGGGGMYYFAAVILGFVVGIICGCLLGRNSMQQRRYERVGDATV